MFVIESNRVSNTCNLLNGRNIMYQHTIRIHNSSPIGIEIMAPTESCDEDMVFTVR